MSNHMQPREVARAKGAMKKHPERYRNEPPAVAQPIGTAPAHLSPQAKACWFEIESLAPLKVLTGADRVAMEMLSELLALFREGPRDFPANKMTHLIGFLARFGMTPSDRQKLGTPPKPDGKDGFDEF